MYSDLTINRLRDSALFQQLFPQNDYVICMYTGDERIYDTEFDGNYNIVVVTGHTLDIRVDRMLMSDEDKIIRWIFIPLEMFTNFKTYFKYNYLSPYEFNDLFLYSLYLVNDNKLIYTNNAYMNKLTELYAMKKLPNIKKYIKYFYQYNEEFINSISSINYIPIKNYMYHLLLMSYIINNETLTIEIIKKIKSIMELIKNGTAFNSDTRKYIDTRLNLLRSLCK